MNKLSFTLVVLLAATATFGQDQHYMGKGQKSDGQVVAQPRSMIPDKSSEGEIAQPGDLTPTVDQTKPAADEQPSKPQEASKPQPISQPEKGESVPEIIEASKSFYRGRNKLRVHFPTAEGKATLSFRYNTAAERRAIEKWVKTYIGSALASRDKLLLANICASLKHYHDALNIDPVTGKSRRLDNYDEVLDIQPDGRSKRLDYYGNIIKETAVALGIDKSGKSTVLASHDERLKKLESGRLGYEGSFNFQTWWLAGLTVVIVIALFAIGRAARR